MLGRHPIPAKSIASSHTMKLLAFAASSSKTSINKQLITYAVTLLVDCQAEILDLNDYELPLFSEDREKELGQPDLAKDFLQKIGSCDALVVSFAEHNGSYSAAYKNLFDWCSRIDTKVFQNKPMVLLATSPGARGASNVLKIATSSAPFFGGDVKASLSIPKFYDNFSSGRVTNTEINSELRSVINSLHD